VRARLRAATALGVLAAAVTGAGVVRASSEATAGAATSRPTACLERPIVVAYLHHLQDRVMARWVVPEDTPTDQTVVVRFRLAEDGSLLTYAMLSATSQRVANTVELAMQHSGPFGRIPENATCVVGRAIDMRFENPY
jgi:hypothetical protein